jgi:hypothetical protein
VKKTTKKSALKKPSVANDESLQRVRRICIALPHTVEKLSHGEPTFFAGKKVYATHSGVDTGAARVPGNST